VAKRAQFTDERVEYNVFLFDEPLKGSKPFKIFKVSFTFRCDKLTFIKIRSHRRKFSNSDSVEQKNNYRSRVFSRARIRCPTLYYNRPVKKM
jgi:hypothetical protein